MKEILRILRIRFIKRPVLYSEVSFYHPFFSQNHVKLSKFNNWQNPSEKCERFESICTWFSVLQKSHHCHNFYSFSVFRDAFMKDQHLIKFITILWNDFHLIYLTCKKRMSQSSASPPVDEFCRKFRNILP